MRCEVLHCLYTCNHCCVTKVRLLNEKYNYYEYKILSVFKLVCFQKEQPCKDLCSHLRFYIILADTSGAFPGFLLGVR